MFSLLRCNSFLKMLKLSVELAENCENVPGRKVNQKLSGLSIFIAQLSKRSGWSPNRLGQYQINKVLGRQRKYQKERDGW